MAPANALVELEISHQRTQIGETDVGIRSARKYGAQEPFMPIHAASRIRPIRQV